MTVCLDPMAPTDEVLMCYALDGDRLSDEAQIHLTSCLLCQQRISLYAGTHAFLTSTLYRCQCPSSAQLADFCIPIPLQFLSVDERQHIAEHSTICPLCTTELRMLGQNLDTGLFGS